MMQAPSENVQAYILGRPHIHVLRHPTFGCLMDWYAAVSGTGRRVNPVAFDLMQKVHKVAKDNVDTVPYCETIEAIFTALNHRRAEPELEDWRVYATLDRLQFDEQKVASLVDQALQTVYLGGLIPSMMTPDNVERMLHMGFRVSFVLPNPSTQAAYTVEERVAAHYGKFLGSVTSAWGSGGVCSASRYGKVMTGDEMLLQHTRQKRKDKDHSGSHPVYVPRGEG